MVNGDEGVSDGDNLFPLRNIPPVSASASEAPTCFSVWKTVSTGPFSFCLSASVGGG